MIFWRLDCGKVFAHVAIALLCMKCVYEILLGSGRPMLNNYHWFLGYFNIVSYQSLIKCSSGELVVGHGTPGAYHPDSQCQRAPIYMDLAIYWPQCQYIVWYFTPGLSIVMIFSPPSKHLTLLSVVHEAVLLVSTIIKCGVFYIYIVFMNSERIGVEQVHQNQMRWWLMSCFNLLLLTPFITWWNHVLVAQNESIINTREIINMTLI